VSPEEQGDNDKSTTPIKMRICYGSIVASPVLISLIAYFVFPGNQGREWWIINPWYSFLISIAAVSSGTSLAVYFLHKSRKRANVENEKVKKKHTHCKDLYKGSFSDIIRDGNYYASLPRFQFLLWTLVISFTFLSVYLLRISGGEFGFPTQIPNEVLALMGISVIVPVISNPLSAYKYDDRSLAPKPPCKEEITPVSDMLLESGKPALFRYQMFLWTLIGIGIYLLLFFSDAIATINEVDIINIDKDKTKLCKQLDMQLRSTTLSTDDRVEIQNQFTTSGCEIPLRDFSLPNIDPSFVILTGISQGGYLTGKLVARTPIKIERVVKGLDKKLTIIGSNFLTAGIVLVDDKAAKSENWGDSIIEVSVEDESKLKNWSKIEVITNESTQAKYERERPNVVSTKPMEGERDVS